MRDELPPCDESLMKQVLLQTDHIARSNLMGSLGKSLRGWRSADWGHGEYRGVTAGHVEVLKRWASSQVEPKYDRQALYHATCHGRVP